MVVGVAKWLQDWSNIRMEQCKRVGVLPRKKESVRPEGEREQGTYTAKGMSSLYSMSRDCSVALNVIVPYRIEYKEEQQGQDDEDQYTDVYKSPDRDSR